MLRKLSVTPRNLSLPLGWKGQLSEDICPTPTSAPAATVSWGSSWSNIKGIINLMLITPAILVAVAALVEVLVAAAVAVTIVQYLPPTQLRKRQGHVICPVPLGSNRFQASWRWHQAFHSEVAIQGWWELDIKAINHPKKSTISFFMRSLNKKKRKSWE